MTRRQPTYSFDTSAFIDPWRRVYPPQQFPTLWERMAEVVASGAVIASDQVLADLKKRSKDELLDWVLRHARGIFRPDTTEVQAEAGRILAKHPRLATATHGHSDPFVIAHASIAKVTVVTHERARSLLNPKIPDVCAAVGIDCIGPLDLIRREGWVF